MLPDFRFVIGAVLASSVLAVAALGVLTAARLTHQVKGGPLEPSRSLAFDDRSDWNQFYDPDNARRFEELARKSDAPAQRAAETTPAASTASEIAAPPPDASPSADLAAPAAADPTPTEPPRETQTGEAARPEASPSPPDEPRETRSEERR